MSGVSYASGKIPISRLSKREYRDDLLCTVFRGALLDLALTRKDGYLGGYRDGYVSIAGTSEELLRLDQSGGYIALVWEWDTPIYSLPELPLERMSGERSYWFTKPCKYSWPVDGWRSAAIAHWCLILAVGSLWVGWLLLRWRRMHAAKTLDFA